MHLLDEEALPSNGQTDYFSSPYGDLLQLLFCCFVCSKSRSEYASNFKEPWKLLSKVAMETDKSTAHQEIAAPSVSTVPQ